MYIACHWKLDATTGFITEMNNFLCAKSRTKEKPLCQMKRSCCAQAYSASASAEWRSKKIISTGQKMMQTSLTKGGRGDAGWKEGGERKGE